MLNIIPILAIEDNYIWTLRNDQYAIVVDPGDAVPVIKYLEENNLQLLAILVTHHHRDHIGGINDLVELYNSPVYGPRREKIPHLSIPLDEGDVIEFKQLNFKANVIDIPGHTLGHIAYLWKGGMFCGDTMFTCGCGKIFEGTPEQLHHSLQRLASQSDDTLVYCTHEYTEYNTPFAQLCEPSNIKLKQRVIDAEALRSKNIPTVPSTMRLERETNPFLRCKEIEIIKNIEEKFGVKLPSNDEQAAFTALRKWRDLF
jgi:hydroxyacylglutathione hydrolase